MTFASTLLPLPAETLARSRYDVACRALAAAKAVDDVMVDVVAHADAVRVYARQAKNRRRESDAAEIRIRAERRLGELMAAQKATVGAAKGGGDQRPDHRVGRNPGDLPTLGEAGIDRNLAHRARTYAAVPQEKFGQLLTDMRQGENRRVVLDPDVEAKAGAAAGDIESERDSRIAPAGADGRAAGNDRLARPVAGLRRRLAVLIAENGALQDCERMWKERALAAGWTEGAA